MPSWALPVEPPLLDEEPAGRGGDPEADDGADGPGPRAAEHRAANPQADDQPGAGLVEEPLALLAPHRQGRVEELTHAGRREPPRPRPAGKGPGRVRWGGRRPGRWRD